MKELAIFMTTVRFLYNDIIYIDIFHGLHNENILNIENLYDLSQGYHFVGSPKLGKKSDSVKLNLISSLSRFCVPSSTMRSRSTSILA